MIEMIKIYFKKVHKLLYRIKGGGNVLNYVQKILEIEKGHGKKVCVDQNTDFHPFGGTHDPWQEV